MGRAKPLTIGNNHFPRQMDAVDHYSRLLARTQLGEKVTDPVDVAELVAVLARHIQQNEKIGDGVDYFTAMLSPEGSKCFGIRRVDGSLVDFSFHRCIKQNW